MGFFDFIFGRTNSPVQPVSAPPPGVQAYSNTWTISFDGEKNVGKIGPIKQYVVDNAALSARAWQLYLESEICQTIIKRFSTWVIGKGLKLQAEPNKDVLSGEGVSLPKEFIAQVETRFKVFSNDAMSDLSTMVPLQKRLTEIFVNAINSGDVLVIQRYEKGTVKIQVIDGCNVSTPVTGIRFDGCEYKTESGNIIRQGVEIDSTGNHIAYYVKVGMMRWERVPAIGINGLRVAFLVYGLKYRIDSTRGIPLISAVMETASKMDRYKEATLASAEEASKLAFTIEHNAISTGENPFNSHLAKSQGISKPASGDNPVDVNGKQLLANVAATANKQAINMPNGASLKAVESKKELYFNDFYTINIQIVCATIGIPPEVAMQKYDSNFSASRAALKDWENTLNVTRDRFSSECLQLIYNFWLETEILKNKVTAPGYMQAIGTRNYMVLAAYRYARFVGATVPHIDPVKEVEAQRRKLGNDKIPLTTVEAATEELNGGDSEANMAYFAEELAQAIKLGIIKVDEA